MSEYHKKWYKENKEKIDEYHKRWAEKNKEKIRAYGKKYYQEHKSKIKEKRDRARHRKIKPTREETKSYIEYFDTEQEYRQRMLDIILQGDIIKVLVRGTMEYYQNLPLDIKRDWKTICNRWNIEFDTTKKYFIFRKS